LKPEFTQTGAQALDLVAAVQEFCRHVQYLRLAKDDCECPVPQDWNTDGALATITRKVAQTFELRLALFAESTPLIASNAGFLICKDPVQLMPNLTPAVAGGEINVIPGAVDLNIARDTIIENSRSRKIRAEIRSALKGLLIEAVYQGSDRNSELLPRILMIYLEEATRYERPGAHERISAEPPLNSSEASELLIDAWTVTVNGRVMSLRQALREAQLANRGRVYWFDRYEGATARLFRESLVRGGFIVIEQRADYIPFKGGVSAMYSHLGALLLLASRYEFDVVPIDRPAPSDLSGLIVSAAELAPAVADVLRELEQSGRPVYVGRLRDAPPAFTLAGQSYLNLDHPVVNDLLSAADHRRETVRAFLLGLLQLRLDLAET
jgi:hypothetical protein